MSVVWQTIHKREDVQFISKHTGGHDVISYAFAIVGLILLLIGGEFLVRGSVVLARRLGVSSLVIGLVVVGFGTSTPELVVVLQAAVKGNTDIALGSVVGSNIANILLIIGAAAIICPIRCPPRIVRRDGVMMVVASLALAALATTGQVGLAHGLIMLVIMILYIGYSYRVERSGHAELGRMHRHKAEEFGESPKSAWLNVVMLIAGLTAVAVGARLLIDGAVTLARNFGVSEAVIGLTLVAVGTSLPELATSLVATYRRRTDVVLGNVLGSNILNILAILGITSLFVPIAVGKEILDDVTIMVVVTAVLTVFLVTGWRLSRWEGILFLCAYGLYVAWRFGAILPNP